MLALTDIFFHILMWGVLIFGIPYFGGLFKWIAESLDIEWWDR